MRPYSFRLSEFPDRGDIRFEGRTSKHGKIHSNTKRRARRILGKLNRTLAKRDLQNEV